MQIVSKSINSKTILYRFCCFGYSKCIYNFSHEYDKKDSIIDQQYVFLKSKYINRNKCMAKNKKWEKVSLAYHAKINTFMHSKKFR